MKYVWLVAVLSIVSLPISAGLTDEDIERIREVVKVENQKIHADMVTLELKLAQKIQESENRLRAELNSQLNARIGDFTIVFGIVSGGFFLLFASVLVVNALRGRTLADTKTMFLLVLSVLAAVLCFGTNVKAQQTRFETIICKELRVTDDNNLTRIRLAVNEDGMASVSVNDILGSGALGMFTAGGEVGGTTIALGGGADSYKAILGADKNSSALVLSNDNDSYVITLGVEGYNTFIGTKKHGVDNLLAK